MKYLGKNGLRVKNNKVWHEGNFDPSDKSDKGHKHTKSEITDFPTSLPANGGNADTVDGKHASDFALASHTHTVDAITGNLETTRLTEPSYITGNVTITAKPLFDVLRADRTAFLPASQIIIEQSIDGGATWEDAGISDTNKAKLFTGQRPSIAIPRKDGKKNTDCMLRITITGMKYNVPPGTAETTKYNYWNSNYVTSTERYFTAEDAWLWVNSNSDRIYCKVERATGANPNDWITVREAFLSGWAGGNYIKLGGANFGGGTSQTNNYWNWRFTFRTATTSRDFNNAKLNQTYITQAQVIYHIKISGRNVWTSPNNLMYHDHLYTWDENQNAIFPEELKAKTFKNASGKEVAYQNDIPTKLSQLNKDINFDERYYTESEVDNKLNSKVDKVSGKGLSTEDYTTAEKNKLSGIEAGANKYIHPSTHSASMITESTSRRFVSDAEKASWNSKAEMSDIPTKVSQLENDKNYVTQSDLGNAGYGDMMKSIYDTNNNGIVDNAEKVNGFTVGTNVPANAKFTDTVTTINGKTGAITKADIVALGIPAQDTNTTYSEITTAEIDAGTSSTLRTITARRVKYIMDKVKSDFPASLPANGGHATSAKHLIGDDTRDANSPPSEYMNGGSRYEGRAGWQTEFKRTASIGVTSFLSGTYCFLETKTPWSDPSGGYPIQIAYGNGNPVWRVGTSNTTWSEWQPFSKSLHIGTSAPSNHNIGWVDTSL